MRLVVFDLVGDARWKAAAEVHHAEYIPVDPALWAGSESGDVVVVDGRGAFEHGLDFSTWLRSFGGNATRILVTERELPIEHQRAYGAGVTRVVVMGLEQTDHAALLGALATERGQ